MQAATQHPINVMNVLSHKTKKALKVDALNSKLTVLSQQLSMFIFVCPSISTVYNFSLNVLPADRPYIWYTTLVIMMCRCFHDD